eukprot:365187-Chlamydomonas_euryale.AAC.10
MALNALGKAVQPRHVTIGRRSKNNPVACAQVDDLIATGGTLNAGIKLIEKVGAEVVEAACVIELPFLKGRDKIQGTKLHVLVEKEVRLNFFQRELADLQPAILVCKNGVAIATQVGRCALVPQHTFFQAGRQRGVGVQLRHSVHQMPAPSKPQPSVTALSRDFARSSFAARPPEAGRSFLPGIALPFTWRPLGKLVDVSSAGSDGCPQCKMSSESQSQTYRPINAFSTPHDVKWRAPLVPQHKPTRQSHTNAVTLT